MKNAAFVSWRWGARQVTRRHERTWMHCSASWSEQGTYKPFDSPSFTAGRAATVEAGPFPWHPRRAAPGGDRRIRPRPPRRHRRARPGGHLSRACLSPLAGTRGCKSWAASALPWTRRRNQLPPLRSSLHRIAVAECIRARQMERRWESRRSRRRARSVASAKHLEAAWSSTPWDRRRRRPTLRWATPRAPAEGRLCFGA